MNGFDMDSLEMLRKGLNRMPRRVSQAHQHRAGVVLPLCNVDNVPCILFEKRSAHLRAHPDEVCLPGGMVSSSNDNSIVATCLREMSEEIEGIDDNDVSVLGVLRCNWGEVHHLVGVAVTPVVCFIGDITSVDLRPSPDEVAECFTVPLDLFLNNERWVHRKDFAPMFTGGPYAIWGLTGYIVNRFVKDILARHRVQIQPYEPFFQKFRP
jgi:8-oxo-dGTP pyrophosphatase MutT (NUDIX family)